MKGVGVMPRSFVDESFARTWKGERVICKLFLASKFVWGFIAASGLHQGLYSFEFQSTPAQPGTLVPPSYDSCIVQFCRSSAWNIELCCQVDKRSAPSDISSKIGGDPTFLAPFLKFFSHCHQQGDATFFLALKMCRNWFCNKKRKLLEKEWVYDCSPLVPGSIEEDLKRIQPM